MAGPITVGDVIESPFDVINDFIPVAKEWFDTGWFYFSNGMFTELTLGQAALAAWFVLWMVNIVLAFLGWAFD